MQVEIWSDVACPWCAVGRARFSAAVDELDWSDEVDVRWRSFELDPSAARSRANEVDYVALLADKYGTGLDQARAMVDRMIDTGAEEGIEFRFDLVRRGNTFDAHRVLHLAADRGVQDTAKGRLLRAHHTEGIAIDDHDQLVRLGTEAGLDADEVAEVLATDLYADAVRADEAAARELGIRGVPFFVFDRTHGLSGAQPTEVLRRALQGVRAATVDGEAADQEHVHGHACADGACAT